MMFRIVLFLVFVSFFTSSTAFGQLDSDSNFLHVGFVNNASPSYDVEFEPDKKILLEQPYSWIRDDTSRYNLISYSVDGGEFSPISRLPRGIFSIDIPVDSTSIVFSSVVQYPVSVDGITDYSFSPESPTNDNWFDEKSKIQILNIKNDDSSLFPHEIISWDGPVVEYSGNSAQIFVDRPIHLTAYWDTNYSFVGFFLLLPIVGVVVFFIKRKRGSNQSKSLQKHVTESKDIKKHTTEKKLPPNSDDYEDEIPKFLKQKSMEKLDLLITSKIITPEKGARIKENI